MDDWISQLYTHTTILNSKYLKATNFAGGSLTYTVYPMVTSSFTEWTKWFRPLEPSAWSQLAQPQVNSNVPSRFQPDNCGKMMEQSYKQSKMLNSRRGRWREKSYKQMPGDVYRHISQLMGDITRIIAMRETPTPPSRLYMAVYPHDILMKSHSITIFMVKPSTPILKSPGGPIRCAGEGRWRRAKSRQAGGAGGTLLPRWGRCSWAWDWFKRKETMDFPMKKWWVSCKLPLKTNLLNEIQGEWLSWTCPFKFMAVAAWRVLFLKMVLESGRTCWLIVMTSQETKSRSFVALHRWLCIIDFLVVEESEAQSKVSKFQISIGCQFLVQRPMNFWWFSVHPASDLWCKGDMKLAMEPSDIQIIVVNCG